MNLDMIKFRAKRMDNHEWHKSVSLIFADNDPYLGNSDRVMMEHAPLPDGQTYGNIRAIQLFNPDVEGAALFRVIPSTLCMFSGVTDIKGVEIYDEDFVQDRNDNVYKVVREDAGFYLCNDSGRQLLDRSLGLTVIGNAFDGAWG